MSRATIKEQLEKDYPGVKISFDSEHGILTMNNHRIHLLSDPDELKKVNIFTRAGRNYYQAIAQLLCSKYQLVPSEKSLAGSLITTRDEYDKYRLQNISRDYGIAFLEDGEKVIAIKILSDSENPVLIDDNEREEELDELEVVSDSEINEY